MAAGEVGPNATHQIISDERRRFAVWPEARRLPQGWRFVGKAGSKRELEGYLQMMLVETVPARSAGRAGTSKVRADKFADRA